MGLLLLTLCVWAGWWGGLLLCTTSVEWDGGEDWFGGGGGSCFTCTGVGYKGAGEGGVVCVTSFLI